MESLRNNLPVFSILLISISLVRLIFYYSSFGIDIVSYIDVSEALMLSVPFFVYGLILQAAAAVVMGIMFVILVIFATVKDRIQGKPYVPESASNVPKEKDIEGMTTWEFIKEYYHHGANIIMMIVIIVAAFRSHSSDTLVGALGIAAFLVLIPLARRAFIDTLTERFKIERSVAKMLYFTALVTSGVIAITRMDANSVKNAKARAEYRTQAYVELEGKKIVSGPKYRYIGKTKNYIFFYNLRNRRAEAYPLEDAKGLAIIEPKLFNYFE